MEMEVEYRGKYSETKNWIYGSLINNAFCKSDTGAAIQYIFTPGKDFHCWEDMSEGEDIFEVDPETVGEYSGLTDCNDERIYEKDAVIDLATETLYIVLWGEEEAGFYLFEVNGKRTFYFRNDSKSYKRIGNIIDNPELLEGK